MRMRTLTRTLAAAAAIAAAGWPAAAPAEIGLGADVVSRYVWRGADFGDAVSVQPGIAWSKEALEIGAWSSWAISGSGGAENDLYISYSTGAVSVTVTDYFFPPGDFFNYSDEDGVHILEVSAGVDLGMASVMAAFNFLGDADDSFWVEASVPLAALSGDTEVGLTVGAGNGAYTNGGSAEGDPGLVSISLDVSDGDYFASYILNPDSETTFLVFGRSF